MSKTHREIELKFLINQVQGRAVVAGLVEGPAPIVRKLRSIYYDTPERALRRAGYTLRVRQEKGRWTQTVKSSWSGENAGRGEWEGGISGPTPDRRLAGRTPARAALGRRDLERLFEVTIDRQSFPVERSGAVVEVSLDRGEVRHGDRAASFLEMELELQSGSGAALFQLAASLRESFALRPSFVTKADRGFALIEPAARGGRHFEPPGLTDEMTAGSTFTAIALAALRQIAGNADELRAHPEEEAIHQMRVGLRRLRSTIDIFGPVVSDPCVPGLVAELRWASGELDAGRNLDVFLAGPLGPRPRSTSGASKSAILRRRLLQDRRHAYEAARALAASDRLSALLLDVLTLIEVGRWKIAQTPETLRDRSIASFAAAALDQARRHVRRRARGFDHLSPAKRHKLRIAAKTLRYAADVFDCVFPKRADKAVSFLKATKALLDRLGELNDLAVARAIVAGHPSPNGLAARIVKHEQRQLSAAHRAVKDFADVKRFWPKPKLGVPQA